MRHQVWGNSWDINNWLAYEMRNLALRFWNSESKKKKLKSERLKLKIKIPKDSIPFQTRSGLTSTTRRFSYWEKYGHVYSNRIYLFISTWIGLSFIRQNSRSSHLLKLSPMQGNPRSLRFWIRRRWFRTQVRIICQWNLDTGFQS